MSLGINFPLSFGVKVCTDPRFDHDVFIKNVLKFICLVNEPKNHHILSQSFESDLPIHRNNTAKGDNIINIHKYTILIKANTHNTNISIEYTIVVHHTIIVFNIVLFMSFKLDISKVLILLVFKIANHI